MEGDVVSGVGLTQILQRFETQSGKSNSSEDQRKQKDACSACISFACLLLLRWGIAASSLHDCLAGRRWGVLVTWVYHELTNIF